MSLKQSHCTTFTEYETQFRLLARDIDWSGCALIDQFRDGLNPEVDDYLNVLEDCGALVSTSTFDEVVNHRLVHDRIVFETPANPETSC